MRKSKREREREAAEAKMREEEANTSRVYEEFVDEFSGTRSSRKSAGAFVRAGETNPSMHPPSGPRGGRHLLNTAEDESVSLTFTPINIH